MGNPSKIIRGLTVEKRVKSDNGKIYYRLGECKKPQAQTIVFTHGFLADHIMFEKQVEYFSESYTVIIWDIPQHGKSKEYKSFSYANAADELNRILEAEETEKTFLVGTDTGSYVSQAFALKYPEKVLAFASISGMPFDKKYYSSSDLKKIDNKAFRMKISSVERIKERLISRAGSTPYGKLLMRLPIEEANVKDKKEFLAFVDLVNKAFVHEATETKFEFPVLLFCGEKDETKDVPAFNQKWADDAGYRLVMVPGAAHLAQCDNPEVVNKEIADFFEQSAS